MRAQLLQMLYSERSERKRWITHLVTADFVGLSLDDPVWGVTVFTKNRDRLLKAEVAKHFLERVLAQARAKGSTSDEHFTVDVTLLERGPA